MRRQQKSQIIAFGLFRLMSITVVGILVWILGFLVMKGIGVLSWEFISTAPTDGMTGGGIFP
ncbi:MAG: phosphate ABC transporter, permease protein PstA, partial [Rikenellaceae bacterium]